MLFVAARIIKIRNSQKAFLNSKLIKRWTGRLGNSVMITTLCRAQNRRIDGETRARSVDDQRGVENTVREVS